MPDGVSAESWKDEHWDEALGARLTLRTSKEAASNVRRFLGRLSGFMTVVGLVTLFLGALGIGFIQIAAELVHLFDRRRHDVA